MLNNHQLENIRVLDKYKNENNIASISDAILDTRVQKKRNIRSNISRRTHRDVDTPVLKVSNLLASHSILSSSTSIRLSTWKYRFHFRSCSRNYVVRNCIFTFKCAIKVWKYLQKENKKKKRSKVGICFARCSIPSLDITEGENKRDANDTYINQVSNGFRGYCAAWTMKSPLPRERSVETRRDSAVDIPVCQEIPQNVSSLIERNSSLVGEGKGRIHRWNLFIKLFYFQKYVDCINESMLKTISKGITKYTAHSLIVVKDKKRALTILHFVFLSLEKMSTLTATSAPPTFVTTFQKILCFIFRDCTINCIVLYFFICRNIL